MVISQDINRAVAILKAGGLVAFPTETVYGLGADAKNQAAVRKVFRAKKRPFDHPLIVHIGSIEQLQDWAKVITPEVLTLAHEFWPGPLTMILKKQPHVLDIVTGGQDTVGVRIPNHPIALTLLAQFGDGIAAPSANRFTHISPTSAQAVEDELGQEVDLILDGGECAVGLESTILDMSQNVPTILRPGMIMANRIQDVVGQDVISLGEKTTIRTAGMHHVHYAPKTLSLLIRTSDMTDYLQSLREQELPIALVTHTRLDVPQREGVQWIQMPPDAMEYAHRLYATLRCLDHARVKCIMIEMVPENAKWDAIRDRLLKATGARYHI